MPASKIVDAEEVKRWFAEGRTHQWMVNEYRRRYNVEVVVSTFGNFRRRHGLERRIARNDDLMPWHVAEVHRWHYPAQMLRLEARRREGRPLSAEDDRRLTDWLHRLKSGWEVVHYDFAEGWSYVPRRASDSDIIRKPARKTTPRKRAS